MALRAFVRKSILNCFLSVTYEQERPTGVAELLEILGSIINGFALPLKDEHKRFLIRGLIPLHKAKQIGSFYQQLAYCIMQYVEKDNSLAEPVILALLRLWPVMNSPKQVLFLHEVEELLEFLPPQRFPVIIPALFKRLSFCIG